MIYISISKPDKEEIYIFLCHLDIIKKKNIFMFSAYDIFFIYLDL